MFNLAAALQGDFHGSGFAGGENWLSQGHAATKDSWEQRSRRGAERGACATCWPDRNRRTPGNGEHVQTSTDAEDASAAASRNADGRTDSLEKT